MLKRKKAQSTLEYALLLAVVLLAIIYGANSVIKVKAKENMDTAKDLMKKATDKVIEKTVPPTITPPVEPTG